MFSVSRPMDVVVLKDCVTEIDFQAMLMRAAEAGAKRAG